MKKSKIENIKNSLFHKIIDTYVESGWEKEKDCDMVYNLAHYNFVTLSKDNKLIEFEWENTHEGTITGPRDQIELIKEKLHLTNN